MGVEFSEYLTFTVFRSVVKTDKQVELIGPQAAKLWNARHDGWPDSPKPYEVDVIRKWVADQYDRLCEACGVAVAFNQDKTVHFLSPKLVPEHGSVTLDAQIRRPLLPMILRAENTRVNDQAVKDFLRGVGNESAARGQQYRAAVSVDSQEGLIERAVRSLHDWRATLHFLAELDVIPDVKDERKAFVTQHDPGVVDSFNTNITWGRKPNLSHSMLAHLAVPMRTRLVLTTNFDTLLEDAFSQLNQALEVIPVGIHSHLPSPHTVHAQNTLVKMHGALTDTRADYSLDDIPTPTDKARFFNYVTGGRPPRSNAGPLIRELQEQPPPFLSTHLLVVGFSGNDNRILQMMKFVLDHSLESQIFWVCFDSGDLAAIPRLFPEEDYTARIEVTVTDRVDLLLLELHQKLTCSLPRGGFSYQFSHDVPPKLWKRAFTGKKEHEEDKHGPGEEGQGGEKIARRITVLSRAISNESSTHRRKQEEHVREAMKALALDATLLVRPWSNQNRILIADTESGLMAVLKEAFEILKKNRFSCIWMEMEDYANAQELAHSLLQIIALRRGLFQLEHAVLMPALFSELLKKDGPIKDDPHSDRNNKGRIPGGCSHAWREHFFQMARYLGIQKERWVLFFYGRNVPGICTGWDRSPWEREQYEVFHQMLDGLAANGFQVVYAPYSRRRWWDDFRKADATRKREQLIQSSYKSLQITRPKEFPGHLWNPDEVKEDWIDTVLETRLTEQQSGKLQTHIIDSPQYEKVAIRPHRSSAHYVETLLPYFDHEIIQPLYPKDKDAKPLQQDVLRAQFLYSCSLFRRSRPMSAFLSEGVIYPPRASNSDGLDNDWLRQRQAEAWVIAFREKGFVWRKPSGNMWLYRDVRLGMQALLQKHLEVPTWSEEKPVRLTSAYQLRARSHFWIAAWYARAFYTTSHSVPLIEALHHLYRSLEFAPLAARPGATGKIGISTYRRQIWIRSLSSMIKLLKVGRAALLFWLDRPAAEAMFGPEAMRSVHKELELSRERCFTGIDDEQILAHVATHAQRLKELFFAEWGTLWSEFERSPFQSEFGNNTQPEEKARTNYSVVGLFAKGKDWRRRLPEATSPLYINGDLLDALEEHEEKSGSLHAEINDTELYEKLRTFGDRAGRDHLGKDSLQQLIQALDRLAFEHSQRAKIVQVVESTKLGVPGLSECLPACELARRLWAQVTFLCRSVFNLCRSVSPHLVDFDYSVRVNTATHYGLALGHLARFTEAHRRLNEANARLSKLSLRIDQVEPAVIELRRAEVYLVEAIFIAQLIDSLIKELINCYEAKSETIGRRKSGDNVNAHVYQLLLTLLGEHPIDKFLWDDAQTIQDGTGSSSMQTIQQWWELYQLSDIALTDRIHANNRKLAPDAISAFADSLVKHLSRIHFAKLDDAWVALEQTERLLSGRNRSSRWWGALCTLRLKIFAEHLDEKTLAREIPQPAFISKLAPISCSTMAFRRKIDYHEYLVSLLRVGLAVWPDDSFRRFRLADYFVRAWKRVDEDASITSDTRMLLIESLQPCATNLTKKEGYRLLIQYQDWVRGHVYRFLM
jgi:SIR2-like domain